METRLWRLRMAALMGAGVFAVHQLRFLLAFGPHSGSRLAAEGHGYLVPLAPLLVWLLLAVFAHLLMCVARGAPARAPRVLRLWAGASVGLIAAYCVQELVEGTLSAGHPGGVGGIFGLGGWVAVPLAVAIGLAIALVMRGAAAAPALLLPGRPLTPPRASAPLELALPALSPVPRTLRIAAPPPARGPPAASA